MHPFKKIIMNKAQEYLIDNALNDELLNNARIVKDRIYTSDAMMLFNSNKEKTDAYNTPFKMKTKYLDIEFSKKQKHSGFHILPMLVLNTSYKTLTFAIFIFVVKFQYNSKEYCSFCDNTHRNKIEASNCQQSVF